MKEKFSLLRGNSHGKIIFERVELDKKLIAGFISRAFPQIYVEGFHIYRCGYSNFLRAIIKIDHVIDKFHWTKKLFSDDIMWATEYSLNVNLHKISTIITLLSSLATFDFIHSCLQKINL